MKQTVEVLNKVEKLLKAKSDFLGGLIIEMERMKIKPEMVEKMKEDLASLDLIQLHLKNANDESKILLKRNDDLFKNMLDRLNTDDSNKIKRNINLNTGIRGLNMN